MCVGVERWRSERGREYFPSLAVRLLIRGGGSGKSHRSATTAALSDSEGAGRARAPVAAVTRGRRGAKITFGPTHSRPH